MGTLGDVTGIGDVAKAVGGILDKIIPDKTAAQAAKDALAAQMDNEDFQLVMGQLRINENDAKAPGFFQSGWRPSVGWIGSISLALVYWPKAIFLAGVWIVQVYMILKNAPDISHVILPVYPDLGLTDIIGLLTALLGMGALRQRDKEQGTDTK